MEDQDQISREQHDREISGLKSAYETLEKSFCITTSFLFRKKVI